MAWYMFNDCFVSIVAKDCKADELLVRSRRPGDIQKLFPKANVTEYDKSDYQFRAVVKIVDVKAAMAAEVDRIVYNNFKNSVRDHDLHNAYNAVWGVMAKLQPKAPYSGLRRKGEQPAFFDFGAEMAELDARAPARGKAKPDAQVRKNLKKLTRGQ